MSTIWCLNPLVLQLSWIRKTLETSCIHYGCPSTATILWVQMLTPLHRTSSILSVMAWIIKTWTLWIWVTTRQRGVSMSRSQLTQLEWVLQIRHCSKCWLPYIGSPVSYPWQPGSSRHGLSKCESPSGSVECLWVRVSRHSWGEYSR
jgi:hypothetical protein